MTRLRTQDTKMTGEELRAIRTKLKLNQEEFGRLLGMSRVEMSRKETGDIAITQAQAIAARSLASGAAPQIAVDKNREKKIKILLRQVDRLRQGLEALLEG